VIAGDALPEVARTWWLGDAAGALVVIPLALAWYRPPPRGWARGRAVEAVLMLAAVAGISEITFRSESPLAYLVFPALGWAALRFGRRGATLAIAVAVGFAVWNTTHFHGPFVFDSITLSVLNTQLYVGVATLATLCLAALVFERKQVAERLDASRARLLTASDSERRRLEHNLHDGAQQRLTALGIRLAVAAERAHDAHETGAAALDAATSEVALAISELRDLTHGHPPAALMYGGLASAIRGMAARSTVPITIAELPPERFDDGVEATTYYVVAEVLTNVQKHAQASSVSLRATTTSRSLELEIADDGIGGATEPADGGLIGLRDRVEAMGGTFDIDSPRGDGTWIHAAIPIRRSAPAGAGMDG
jgi:signal transduction histidine kinase